MNLREQKEKLNREKIKIQDSMKNELDSFIEQHNEESSYYSIDVEQWDEESLKMKIYHEDFKISIDIYDLYKDDESINLSLETPSLYSHRSNLLDEKEFIATNNHMIDNQRLFTFAKAIKDNIKLLKPKFKTIFDLKNNLDDKIMEMKENLKDIEKNIEEVFLDDIKKDFHIASEKDAKDLFQKMNFEWDDTIYIINAKTYTDNKNTILVEFVKNELEIENSGRLSCRYNGNRIAKKDIEGKLEGGVIINDELTQKFNFLQETLAIPGHSPLKKSINIMFDDYYRLKEKKSNQNSITDFLEQKKSNILEKIMDSNYGGPKKKKIGIYGFK